MLDLEIRERIADFARGDLDAAQLEDWLEDASWDEDAEPTRALAATVLRLLAEHANGDWTASEMREHLGALSRNYWFEQAPKTALAGSDTPVIRQDQRSAAAGRWRVAESV